MELSTGLGLVVAIVAFATSILIDGGSPASLVNVSAVIMVIGGSMGACLVAYPLQTVTSLPTLIAQSFKADNSDPHAVINQFVQLADQARREGLLSLEEAVHATDDELIKRGIMLIVDGVDPAIVRNVLEIENDLASRRHGVGVAMLDTLGSVAPAMGMIGTVIGLIGVLRDLSDPSNLGPSIAVAFTTTLYGVMVANLLWNPLSSKLKQKDKDEMISREVVVEGIIAIQAGENPRLVREKLESFLAPKLRSEEASDSR